MDAFVNAASGYRLLFVSRPPIVYYGLYGLGGPDEASHTLLNIVIARGRLAEMLDCYMGCHCGAEEASCQIKLDKILYDVDRAIDLYAQGADPMGEGEPEHRAAAYGFIVASFIEYYICCLVEDNQKRISSGKDALHGRALLSVLRTIRRSLWHEQFMLPMTIDWILDNHIESIPIPHCGDGPPPETEEVGHGFGELGSWVQRAYATGDTLEEGWEIGNSAYYDTKSLLDSLKHELCVQRDSERKWKSLLQTMAPSCIRFNGSITATEDMVNHALEMLYPGASEACPSFTTTIPPTLETSFDSLVQDHDSQGTNRTSGE